MSNQQLYEMADAEYSSHSFRTIERVKNSKTNRPSMGRRRSKGPNLFNGMHRRRRRKITW